MSKQDITGLSQSNFFKTPSEQQGHALLRMALAMQEPTPSLDSVLGSVNDQTRQFIVSAFQTRLGFNILDTEPPPSILISNPTDTKKDSYQWHDQFSRWEHQGTPYTFKTEFQQKALAFLEKRRTTFHPDVTHAEILKAIGYKGSAQSVQALFRTTNGRLHPAYKLFIQSGGKGKKGMVRLNPEVLRRPINTFL